MGTRVERDFVRPTKRSGGPGKERNAQDPEVKKFLYFFKSKETPEELK